MALLIAVITAASAATQPSTGPACEVVASLGCYVDSAAVRVLPSGMKAPAQPASLETCASLVAAQVGSAAMPDTLLGVEAGKQLLGIAASLRRERFYQDAPRWKARLNLH